MSKNFKRSYSPFLPLIIFEPEEFDLELSHSLMFFCSARDDDGEVDNFPVAKDGRIDKLFFLFGV